MDQIPRLSCRAQEYCLRNSSNSLNYTLDPQAKELALALLQWHNCTLKLACKIPHTWTNPRSISTSPVSQERCTASRNKKPHTSGLAPSLPSREPKQAQAALPQGHTLQKKSWPGAKKERDITFLPSALRGRTTRSAWLTPWGLERGKRREKAIAKASAKQSKDMN